eukprot:1150050-Pelagomonas_calceolata.AAC.11
MLPVELDVLLCAYNITVGASTDVGGAGGLAGDDFRGKSSVAGDLGGGAAIFTGSASEKKKKEKEKTT